MNLILVRELLQQISDEVSGWPQVTAGPHAFGGTEYRFDQAEIGHIHRDGTLDIPYPISVRNELIAEGMVERHRFLPETGWTTFHVNAANLERGLWLLRLSYLRYAVREAGKVDGWDSPRAESLLKELQRAVGADLFQAMESALRFPRPKVQVHTAHEAPALRPS